MLRSEGLFELLKRPRVGLTSAYFRGFRLYAGEALENNPMTGFYYAETGEIENKGAEVLFENSPTLGFASAYTFSFGGFGKSDI